MTLTGLFKDARYFQILFQSLFLMYGILYLHWENEYALYAVYFLTSLSVQFICEWLLGNKNISYPARIRRGIPSVLISSFGLSLLLKTNLLWVGALAAAISIVSKFLVRIHGKHIFNPSALGIVIAIFLPG